MDRQQAVNAFCQAFESGDDQVLEMLLADNFRYIHNGDGVRANKAEFIRLIRQMHHGIPDLRLHVRAIHGDDPVDATVRMSGTHVRMLDLTPTGPRVEPTGESFWLPEEPAHWRIGGEKVTLFEVDTVPGGGISGILEQVSATLSHGS